MISTPSHEIHLESRFPSFSAAGVRSSAGALSTLAPAGLQDFHRVDSWHQPVTFSQDSRALCRPFNAQTNAPTQPIPVHPNERFVIKIGMQLGCPRPRAINEGAQYASAVPKTERTVTIS